MTPEQKQALIEMANAMWAYAEGRDVKFQRRDGFDDDWEDGPVFFTEDSDDTPMNEWFRIKPEPSTRPMTWDEIPFGEIEWVRLSDFIARIVAFNTGAVLITNAEGSCWYTASELTAHWRYTTDRDPRNAEWKKFEVEE